MVALISSKIRVGRIVSTHYGTLSVPHRGDDDAVASRLSWTDLGTFVLFPLAAGAALWIGGVRAPAGDRLIPAVALLTGLLFALLVLMLDRIRSERAKDAPDVGNDPLVDAWELFANVSYAILVSTTILSILLVTALFSAGPLHPALTGVLAALVAHLLLTMLMIVKRVFQLAVRLAGPRKDRQPA
ncbi:MAG: hypothetical protein ACR2FG_15395 [Marmoricola sp.]